MLLHYKRGHLIPLQKCLNNAYDEEKILIGVIIKIYNRKTGVDGLLTIFSQKLLAIFTFLDVHQVLTFNSVLFCKSKFCAIPVIKQYSPP